MGVNMKKITNFDSYEFNSAPLTAKLVSMNTTIIGFVKWCIENKKMRVVGLREALIDMRFEQFSQSDAKFFKSEYSKIKGDADRTTDRCLVLQALVLQCLQYDMKDFFLTVFKKERHLDMRIYAIRGYAAYVSETEIIPLMDKFYSVLVKRAETTPWNYIEYEYLRSKFGLPYLVKHYGYDCFKNAMAQLEKQYDDMPNELKGYFTLDENGIQIQLLSDGESKRRFNTLLEKHRASGSGL
jgi:hypothetical protein